MDFRGPTVGNFVYHCHNSDHEDGGMMAIIRVNPSPTPAAPAGEKVTRAGGTATKSR
ncbi:MAG: multicopper oxidase domain-containing protein [Chthoniobacterales bacterium]